MHFSLHIAPVGLGPWYNQLNRKNKIMYFLLNSKTQFVTGPSPIPALTCPDTPELGIPSIHSLGYGLRSSPAFSRICPASASGILVQYAG
jgi:hypothetical protein